MGGKRTRKDEDETPIKRRHIELNDENVDVTNMTNAPSTSQISQMMPGTSQVVMDSRVLNMDPTLKSGKIVRISLKNFMCHSNFAVDLNKNINVFVGLNGSGKSAILAALTIGLGGNANSTARSSNLKDLVKQGTTQATIEITISNDGIDSFEHEVYGDKITIVRTINANSSASKFTLKSSSGRTVSTVRKELSKLIMCLNIQVDNPVLILNQDAARSFLKECDPKKLYVLFMKATQLEVIINKLHSCISCATSSKAQLDHLDRSIHQLRADIATIEEKREKLQSVARLRGEIVGFENELDWLKVSEAQVKLDEIKTKFNKAVDQINNIKDLILNRNTNNKQLKNKIIDLGTKFIELKASVTTKDGVAESRKEAFEQHKDEKSRLEGIHGTLAQRKVGVDQNVAQLEAEITARETNPLNVENARKENGEKILVLQKKQEDVNLILANARRDHDQFAETLTDSSEKVQQAKEQYEREKNQVQKFIQQKRQMEGSTKDVLVAYGPSMPQLIKRIEDVHGRGGFAEMPRGPLGRYIEVPEQKFKSTVENILDSILVAFYVSCDKDRLALTKILKEFPDFSRSSIIMGAFHKQVYDVRNGMVRLDEGVGRVLMDVIKVSDPVVMNCLIDQRHIETIVLAESTDTAIELTQDSANVPQNLSKVVLMKPLSEYYPAPNYRSYAMREKPVRFIQTSFRDVIAGMEQQKVMHENKMQEILKKIKQFEVGVKEKQVMVRDKKMLMSELHKKLRQYTQEIEELQAIEYPPENEMEFLRGELKELRDKQITFAKKIKTSEAILKEAQEGCVEKEEMLKKCRDEARMERDEMTKIQHEIDGCNQQLSEMANEIKLKSNQIADFEAQRNVFQQQMNEQDQAVESLMRKTKGQKVTTKRTEDNILQAIRSNKKRIETIEAHHDNIEDVELLLKNKTDQVNKLDNVRDVLDQVLKTLENLRTSRFVYIRRLRQHMSLRCKHKFNVLMGLRHYKAEVEIDHKDRTLELKVVPRDSKVAGAVSNTKALSGGERSYSTVAFLISLWSCVDHPFYFLDEYDVFSDEHNRHMMTKLLFNEAHKKPDKQFGFLTPQDFSDIQASDVITIHKLHDPERSN